MTEASETASGAAGEEAGTARSDAGLGLRARVVEAALPHVPFDGWSDKTLAAAVREAGVDAGLSRIEFPRGGIDLLLAYHRDRDAALPGRLAAMELEGLRFRDKVALAIDTRLALVASEKDAVRRGVALCALPSHAADGARALWNTADTIWTALGDASDDFNWYSKRATLSAIYSSALLYWLGDDTPGATRTREFTRRRIDDLMRFEKAKARIAEHPMAAAMLRGPRRLLGRVRAPHGQAPSDLPGWQGE
ncbi:MAG: COQ9 family protein [Rhodovulum sulfidophilum]|uniref:COQ9 family protein n=1 Tax=Rhodovulum sulfidophilum TaxID=35806 RepID=A0A2W5PY21_RHOSU|nr:MAG: COQ9 family protein [Rhodovulum sulfidophilum]